MQVIEKNNDLIYYNEKLEFRKIITELIKNDKVQEMKQYRQHCNISCYRHCLEVAYNCYKISKKFNWDYKSLTRGAMLHDMFLYDWRKKQPNKKGLHAFTHGKIACENACNEFHLTEKERDIIKKHMFPVTISLPKSKEGFLLTIIDKYCTIMETFKYIYTNKINKYKLINKKGII